ncbi:MAG: tripartite tricarboxylate transporter permease [Candidatus Methanofastidiosia archaeon]
MLILGFFGMVCGTITGIVPGIHVNTAAPMAVVMIKNFGLEPLSASSFICAMSVTHTFIDFIPATVMGVPDSETALAVLPAHHMVSEGRGWEAIRISGIASIFAVVTFLVLLAPLLLSIREIYPYIEKSIPSILILFSLATILSQHALKKIALAAVVFALSGVFGYIVFFNPWLSKDPLFPVFSGFFGISTLFLSMKSKSEIPVQAFDSTLLIRKSRLFVSCLKGSLAGMLVATVPGIGASQATIVSNLSLKKRKGEEGRLFIASCCAVNTANALFALLVLYMVGKARNGALVHVRAFLGTPAKYEFFILLSIMIFSSGISFVLLLFISKKILKKITKLNYYKLSIIGISVQLSAVALLTGAAGILLCTVAFFIGILPPILGINRTNLMSFLIVPVLITRL